jgi:Acetyltransferase (GNAT) domain
MARRNNEKVHKHRHLLDRRLYLVNIVVLSKAPSFNMSLVNKMSISLGATPFEKADLNLIAGSYTDQSLSPRCFFLADRWLKLYVELWAPETRVGKLEFEAAGHIFAVFLSLARTKSRLNQSYWSLAVNEGAQSEVRNISIEYNTILCQTKPDLTDPLNPNRLDTKPIFQAFFDCLLKEKSWDEVRFSGFNQADARAITSCSQHLKLLTHVYSVRDTYWINFDQVRANPSGQIIETLSSNSRGQVRRAIKAITKKHGELKISEPSSIDEAQLWLEQLGKWHAARWEDSGANEGFNNPIFVQFHKTQLVQNFDDGICKIFRLQAGPETFALIHGFIWQNRFYFYMNGIDYVNFEVFKPGLIAHCLLSQKLSDEGLDTYDFMAGTMRYKQTLCTDMEKQYTVLVRRKRWYFQIEQLLRQLMGKAANIIE